MTAFRKFKQTDGSSLNGMKRCGFPSIPLRLNLNNEIKDVTHRGSETKAYSTCVGFVQSIEPFNLRYATTRYAVLRETKYNVITHGMYFIAFLTYTDFRDTHNCKVYIE